MTNNERVDSTAEIIMKKILHSDKEAEKAYEQFFILTTEEKLDVLFTLIAATAQTVKETREHPLLNM